MKITKKKVLIVSIVLLILFGIWNIAWYVLTELRYNKFLKAVPENDWGIHAVQKDGYNYNVKRPFYLFFVGNLGVSSSNNSSALIIWPHIFGGYEYGFRLQDGDVAYEILLDDELKPVDKNDKEVSMIVEKYKTEIFSLYNKANDMWEL